MTLLLLIGPLANTTKNVYFIKENGTVTRVKCRGENWNATVNIKKEELKNELATIRLEQDRIFQTCHLVPRL